MKVSEIDKHIIKYLLLASAFILGVFYFSEISSIAGTFVKIVTPLLYGFVIAYVLNIPMKFIEQIYFSKSKKRIVSKLRRPLCLLLSIIIILLILIAVVNIVIPQIFSAFTIITEAFPTFIQRVEQIINENEDKFSAIIEQVKGLNVDWEALKKNIHNLIINSDNNIFNSSFNIVSMILTSLFDFVISIAFACYLLFGKEKLINQLKTLQHAYMKNEHAKMFNTCMMVSNESFSKFIIGQCTEAVILSLLCTISMLIFRFPYAITVGVVIGATALIPFFGAYFGAGIGVFIIFMVSPMKALWFIVFILVLQQIENIFIYPKVVGTSVGLPGIWVLVAVVIGGGIAGITGMLLGVPIAATLYKLLQTATLEKLKKHQISKQTYF